MPERWASANTFSVSTSTWPVASAGSVGEPSVTQEPSVWAYTLVLLTETIRPTRLRRAHSTRWRAPPRYTSR